MADAETIVRHFLRARLVGGPVADRAYDSEIPPGVTTWPVIVWQMQSGVDAQVNGPDPAWNNLLWLVRGIAKTATYSDLDASNDWIEAQINRTAHVTVTQAGVPIGTIVSCVRQQPWRFAEAPNNVSYRHKGGIYRLMVLKV